MMTLFGYVQTSSSGVFHARLLTSTSTDLEDQLEAAWHWLPRCPATSSCNTSILVCLSHAHTSSIPSSSSSSSLSSLSASSSLSSSSSSVQPLCVTPTPAVSASHTHLIARFPIEFTWPVWFQLTVFTMHFTSQNQLDFGHPPPLLISKCRLINDGLEPYIQTAYHLYLLNIKWEQVQNL